MFPSIGMPELVVIFVIALFVFGPSKLADLGKSLGAAIRRFKKAINESDKLPPEIPTGEKTAKN